MEKICLMVDSWITKAVNEKSVAKNPKVHWPGREKRIAELNGELCVLLKIRKMLTKEGGS